MHCRQEVPFYGHLRQCGANNWPIGTYPIAQFTIASCKLQGRLRSQRSESVSAGIKTAPLWPVLAAPEMGA